MNRKSSKRGAPALNANNLISGRRFQSAALPKHCAYITRQINAFRGALEQAVLDKHGEISIAQECFLSTAVRHEVRHQLMMRWLRIGSDGRQHPKATEGEIKPLTTSEKVQLLAEAGRASDARDKAVEKLNLDADQQVPIWAGLEATATRMTEADATDVQPSQDNAQHAGDAEPDPEAAPGGTDATAGHMGDDAPGDRQTAQDNAGDAAEGSDDSEVVLSLTERHAAAHATEQASMDAGGNEQRCEDEQNNN